MSRASNPNTIVPILVVAWLAIALVLWSIGNNLLATANGVVQTLVPEAFSITALVLASVVLLYAGKIFHFVTAAGKVWFFLGIGFVLWTAGEITYTGLELANLSPSPSVADLFYIVAYPMLYMGLILQVRLLKMPLKGYETAIGVILAIFVATVVSWIVLVPVIQGFDLSDSVAVIIKAAYPLLDIMLDIAVIFVFLKIRHGKINVAWILILIGLFATTVADTIYQTATVTYIFNVYDFIFQAGYLLTFLGGVRVVQASRASVKGG
jgi:hypothetical protein